MGPYRALPIGPYIGPYFTGLGSRAPPPQRKLAISPAKQHGTLKYRTVLRIVDLCAFKS